MSAAYKKGTQVKVQVPKSGATVTGKFVQARTVTRGAFYDIEIDGKVKSYRPAQVSLA